MYHALYRKYRPQNFDDVVGQNSIIKTLKNSIKNNHFSHAYIFFGSRGIGKTTVAKIFARTINCISPIEGSACEKCDSCLHSVAKECVDIIEIDAASNNGVDEIRELRNKISLVPSELKYKVYIIDEVHMLSIGAFNALLKTLEEPPEHAVFILATTDLQKVPETIVSRCQCFSFKRISTEMIVERLKYVCEKENIEIDLDVLKEIAISSEGGMRDALGMLDKLSSYTNNKIDMNDYIELNGLVTSTDLQKFIDSIFSADIPEVLNFINDIYTKGRNLIQITINVMYFLRNQVVEFYTKKKEMPYSIELAQELINIINKNMFDIKKSGNARIYIEIMFIQFVEKYIKYSEIISREIISEENSTEVKKQEQILNNNQDDKKIKEISNNTLKVKNQQEKENIDKKEKLNKRLNKNAAQILNIKEIMRIRLNNAFALADKQRLKKDIDARNALQEYAFDQEIGYLVCELLDAQFRVSSENILVISYEYDSMVQQNLRNLEMLTDVYNKITNSNKKLSIITDEDWNNAKKEYILNIKEGKKYEEQKEPEKIYEELPKDDIIGNSAIELFGKDIVEIVNE